MPEAAPSNTPSKKRRGLWWKIPLGGVLLLVLAFAIFRTTAYLRVTSRINAIRDAGYPVTPKELNAWYMVASGPNAADVYQKAFEAHLGDELFEKTLPLLGDRVNMPGPGEPMPEDVADRIAHYVRQNTTAISLLEEAAAIEGCRFPVDFESGLFPLLPHLGPLRHSGRLMTFQIITDLEKQKYDSAVDHCLTTLSIAKSLDQEPVLISTLVGVSLRAQAYKQIHRVLQSGGATSEQLQTLFDAVSQASCRNPMSRGMAGERCMGMSIFLDPAETLDVKQKKGARAVVGLWWFSGLMSLDRVYFIDIMSHYSSQADIPVWPLPPDPNDPPRFYLISHLMLPALGKVNRATFRAEMQRVTMMTAITVERYRQAEGTWPASLQNLVPQYIDAVPIDIFADKPLGYSLKGDAAVIYSVGQDGTDQDGRPYDEYGNTNSDTAMDISVVLGAPAKELFLIQEEESPSPEEEQWLGYGGLYFEDPDADEHYNTYIEKLATDGFPELVPRPINGNWSEQDEAY